MRKRNVLLLSLASFVCSSCSSLPRKAYEGRWAEVRAEIEKGADPNALLETSGNSLLFFAAQQGNMEMVRFLLTRGAKPDLMSPDGETPLYGATGSCHPEIVKLLVAHGADPRKPTNFHGTVMHIAAEKCTELIGFFASRGLSANMENPESNELTPLMAAASSGNLESVRELLRLGADIHRRNRDNQNVFDYVFHLRNSDVLILLLDHGAQPVLNQTDFVLSFWGVNSFENIQALLRRKLVAPAQALHAVIAATPFSRGSIATEGTYVESREKIIQKLQQSGVSLNLKDQEGKTALMTAIQAGSFIGFLDFLKFLIQQGASAVGEDNKGRSALSLAVNSYEESMLSTGVIDTEKILAFVAERAGEQRVLLSKSERILLALVQKDDASLKSVINGGYRFENQDLAQIALVYTAAHHGPENLLLLLNAGARPNRPEPGAPGMLCCMRPTALIAAANYGKIENVRILLSKGANAGDRFGCCGGGVGALDVAKEPQIRRMLEAAGR